MNITSKNAKTLQTLVLGILLFLSFSSEANAKLLRYRYFTKGKESPVKILKSFTKKKTSKKQLSKMFSATKKANKSIKSWKKVGSKNGITVVLDTKSVDKKKLKKLLKSKKAMSYKKWLAMKKKKTKKKVAKKKPSPKKKTKEEPKKSGRPEGITGSVFYMASQGTFNQKNEAETIDLNINQNSPVSVGMALNYYPAKSNLSYALSFYYSMLEAPATTGTASQTIEIPAEIGGNLYLQYNLFPKALSFFGGVDYESFTTFNLVNFENDSSFVQNLNNVVYATAGMGKAFIFGTQSIFIKLSASFSVMTLTTMAEGGLEQPGTYSGMKLMAYLNYKFSKHWFVHGLYKMHTMSGPDNLSVTRMGAGFGFAF